MSDSLQPHELQHARPPCPSLTPRIYPNSCSSSRWCHPTISCLPLLLTSLFPSIRVFSNKSALCIRWPKYWSFSFNISPFNEHPGLISFRMDWVDLLSVQGTLKSLLQHHSSKASILWCSNYRTIVLISHTSKVMLKILQARLQRYMNCELPDVQAGFRKSRGTRDQMANIHWIIEKAWEFQKDIHFCFIDYAKAFDCVDHNKLKNSSRDGNTRPLYLLPKKSVCRWRSNS